MKKFRKILLIAAVTLGMAFSVSAQKDEQKPRPPKDPPVINPGDKDKPKPRPPKDDKPKKPEMSFLVSAGRNDYSA